MLSLLSVPKFMNLDYSLIYMTQKGCYHDVIQMGFLCKSPSYNIPTRSSLNSLRPFIFYFLMLDTYSQVRIAIWLLMSTDLLLRDC